jgi:hypothetical protein
VALGIVPADERGDVAIEDQAVQVEKGDTELGAQGLGQELLGQEVQLEQGVAQPEPGPALMVERDPELILGDRLGLDEDVTQPVLLVVPVQDVVELPLGQRQLLDQDLAQRDAGLVGLLEVERGVELLLGDQTFAQEELTQEAPVARDVLLGRRGCQAGGLQRPGVRCRHVWLSSLAGGRPQPGTGRA